MGDWKSIPRWGAYIAPPSKALFSHWKNKILWFFYFPKVHNKVWDGTIKNRKTSGFDQSSAIWACDLPPPLRSDTFKPLFIPWKFYIARQIYRAVSLVLLINYEFKLSIKLFKHCVFNLSKAFLACFSLVYQVLQAKLCKALHLFMKDWTYLLLNKNYYVVGDAGFTRPRNPLKIISDF